MKNFVMYQRQIEGIWLHSQVIINVITAVLLFGFTAGATALTFALHQSDYGIVFGVFTGIFLLLAIIVLNRLYKVTNGLYLYEKDVEGEGFTFAPTTKVSGWVLTFCPKMGLKFDDGNQSGTRTLQYVRTEDTAAFERWISAQLAIDVEDSDNENHQYLLDIHDPDEEVLITVHSQYPDDASVAV